MPLRTKEVCSYYKSVRSKQLFQGLKLGYSGGLCSGYAVVMQVSVSSITTPPRAPPGICTKNSPSPWGFCIQAFARGGGGGFVGEAPEGQAFVLTDVCHF